MIMEQFLIAATNADVLSTGRLNAIPYNGVLSMFFLADLGDVTNFYTATIQLPDGGVPLDTQIVPASGSGLDGVLNSREWLALKFPAMRGGHFTVALTENGTATCAVRFVLT
jgi:hypothetical protein